MKRMLCGLLAAALLWACLSGCTPQPGSDTEPAETRAPAETTVPTTGTAAPEAPAETTGILTPGENVTPPDDMPERPENDYSVPGDERPGGRSETSKY